MPPRDRRDRSALRMECGPPSSGEQPSLEQVTGTSCPLDPARDPEPWNSQAPEVNGLQEKFSTLSSAWHS